MARIKVRTGGIQHGKLVDALCDDPRDMQGIRRLTLQQNLLQSQTASYLLPGLECLLVVREI
jgi:hypothetical protein